MPAVVITLPLEGRPCVDVHVDTIDDEERLGDWLASNSRLARLVLEAVVLEAA